MARLTQQVHLCLEGVFKPKKSNPQTVNIVNVPVNIEVSQSFFVDSSFKSLSVENFEDSCEAVTQKSSSDGITEVFESSQTINSNETETSHNFNSSQSRERLTPSQNTNRYHELNGSSNSQTSHEKTSSESTKDENIFETVVNKCKCIYTNADQLQNKLDELRVQCVTLDVDFVFVTEVLPKYNPDSISCSSMIYHIDGYNAFHSTDNGRGVLIYAKDTYNISPNQYLNSLYHDATWCDWTLDNKTVILGCIYRSPSDNQSCETILQLLNEVSELSENVLITGDFNYKDINWEDLTTIHNETHPEYRFIECLRDNYLFQHVRHFTRCRNEQARNTLGCIDHVTLLFDFICDCKITHSGNPRYLYRKCNLAEFTSEWENVDWTDSFEHCDVEEMWTVFSQKYDECVMKHVPKSRPKKGCKPKPLWMTSETLLHIKRKRHAWNKYLATRRTEDFEQYKRVRNITNEYVKTTKRDYEKNISQKVKTEPKQFWRYVKSKTKSVDGVFNLKNEDGTFTKSDKEKAELLNGFFSTVFTKENLETLPELTEKEVLEDLQDIHVSETEVLKLLKELDSSKSMGPDNINPFLIKSMAEVFVKPLTLIFQKSVSSGIVPSAWKEARITPIFKKGSKAEPSNYRPVSLTSIVCKTLEKIVRKAILTHLTENHLLSDKQYGFRSGRSCSLQLLNVMERWTQYVENHQSWDTVYLDLAKAFDKVAHQRLLRRLSSYGIKGALLSWITSFLTNRRQCVSIKGSTSTWKPVESGVPQGSVLGPILFIIYVNEIPEIVKSHIWIFADDTKLFETSDQAETLQEDLNNLMKWAELWELTFNVIKCKVIHYGQNNPESDYVMNNKKLESVDEECDLGVSFTRDLKFSQHIAKKINKANSILALIRGTFEHLDKYSFLRLYTALVRSHLEFANVVWHPYLWKDIESIERVQMRATKLVPALKDLSYEARLKELKLPTLAHRRLRGDMIQTFKLVKGLDDCPLENFFTIAHYNKRGHSHKLEKPRCSLTFTLNQFSYRVINVWNSLPQHVVDAETLNSFKARLDKHWQGIMVYEY